MIPTTHRWFDFNVASARIKGHLYYPEERMKDSIRVLSTHRAGGEAHPWVRLIPATGSGRKCWTTTIQHHHLISIVYLSHLM